jgi:hypothetical protein
MFLIFAGNKNGLLLPNSTTDQGESEARASTGFGLLDEEDEAFCIWPSQMDLL